MAHYWWSQQDRRYWYEEGKEEGQILRFTTQTFSRALISERLKKEFLEALVTCFLAKIKETAKLIKILSKLPHG